MDVIYVPSLYLQIDTSWGYVTVFTHYCNHKTPNNMWHKAKELLTKRRLAMLLCDKVAPLFKINCTVYKI